MATRTKFGTNFTPKAKIGSSVNSTKNIAFGNLNEDEKEQLRNKLSNLPSGLIKSEETVDISSFIPDDYVIKKIQRNKLKPAPDEWNFFAKPSKDKLVQLAESIYNTGLLQPIIVREMDDKGNYYQILAGHTRNDAYSVLYDIFNDEKYLSIEAIVFPYNTIDDIKAQDIICDTNFMQRGNLPARDMAKCIYLKAKRYKENKGPKGSGSIADKISKEYKIKKTAVFMWQRLANLTDELQGLVELRKITLKNAYKIAFLSPENQHKLVQECYNFLSNDSLKNVKSEDNVDTIIQKIIDSYGVTIKSLRYEVSDNELNNIKDEPVLVYVSRDKKKQIIEEINKIAGAYVLRP